MEDRKLRDRSTDSFHESGCSQKLFMHTWTPITDTPYRSTNGGRTCRTWSFELPRGQIAALAIHPDDPLHLLIEMARGPLYSEVEPTGEFYSAWTAQDVELPIPNQRFRE